jgi:hypothetical protein
LTDVPSFFNRVDFVGKLLPGYLIVTIYLLLFHYNILIGGTVSADILTAIIFIVAGPTIGYAIARFQRSSLFIIQRSFLYIRRPFSGPRDTRDTEAWREYATNYAVLRIEMSSDERSELDQTEAENDFLISTGIGMIFLGLYYTQNTLSHGETPFVLYLLGLFGFGIGLLVTALTHRRVSWGPLISALFIKYEEKFP